MYYIVHYFKPLAHSIITMMLNTFNQEWPVINYLKILILPDQLLPGKDLIGLDALKAMPSLFILKHTHTTNL